jgi:uncharacterized protein (TIGR00297 family)
MAFLTLDMKGVAAALVLGLALLLLGGLNLVFVAFMLYFLLLSSVVTSAGRRRKKAMGVYQKSRSAQNVISNGCGPLIFAFLFFASVATSMPAFAVVSLVGFGASVAAVTSDKFSSELGVLDGQPKDILTFKDVKKGMSGGVTLFGLASGLFAAIMIALPFSFVVFKLGNLLPQYSVLAAPVLIAVVVGGFVGTLVDSLLGHFEEKGIGNKFTSNFICSVCGGLVGMLLLALVV